MVIEKVLQSSYWYDVLYLLSLVIIVLVHLPVFFYHFLFWSLYIFFYLSLYYLLSLNNPKNKSEKQGKLLTWIIPPQNIRNFCAPKKSLTNHIPHNKKSNDVTIPSPFEPMSDVETTPFGAATLVVVWRRIESSVWILFGKNSTYFERRM